MKRSGPRRRRIWEFCAFGAALFCLAAGWREALPGWRYEFPRDHHVHPDFKTEWLYFTGNLIDGAGHRFGYELTFFRQGIRPPDERAEKVSRFVVNDLKFAHFAVSDLDGQHFFVQGKMSRGSFGEAGFDQAEHLAIIDGWQVSLQANGSFDIRAESAETALRLRLVPKKPPVIHGVGGVSPKAAGEGHASHYYSLMRLETSGELRVGDKTSAVTGESWFDHEWATNQLAPGQVGWNWLCVQFADNSELMLYQMRLADGGIDPASSGTFVDPDGTVTHLPASAFRFVPDGEWKSPATGAVYPIGWRVDIPDRQLTFTVSTPLKNQELVLAPLTYWEGAIEAKGIIAGKAIIGRGYLELTGYAAPLQELSR